MNLRSIKIIAGFLSKGIAKWRLIWVKLIRISTLVAEKYSCNKFVVAF